MCLRSGLLALSFVALFLLAQLASADAPDSANRIETEPLQFKVDVIDEERTQPGFTLYPYTGDAKVHLINLDGKIVHTWNVDATRARLLPNCNLLVVHGTDWGKKTEPWRSLRKKVREYSWDGDIQWEYEAPTIAHHDVFRLKNGNTLFPTRVNQKLTLPGPEGIGKLQRKNRSDTLLEVSPEGKVEWSWEAHRFLDIDSCGARECNKPLADERWEQVPRDWTHVNTTSVLPENKWFRAGDERFRPGNVLIMLRNWWQSLLIDRESKQVVWRYNGDYNGGIIAAHESYMIPEPLPGAGNILIFDNGGRKRSESYILEINPVTKNLVWHYEDPKTFYVAAKGAAQRLPNGNTLISTGAVGRIFEVTPQGKVVWDLQGNRSVNRAKRYEERYCPKLHPQADKL